MFSAMPFQGKGDEHRYGWARDLSAKEMAYRGI